MNIAVIAGNYREYRKYLIEQADKANGQINLEQYPGKIENKWYWYISGVVSLRGRVYDSFVFYGTARERDDIAQINEEIEYSQKSRAPHEIRR